MFRFQDNLPEVYINESRDFQILARLSDVLFSGIKYDVDSMINILDATLAKDRMLQLMCTKIGFFPKIEIDSQVLKYIIASFPYIIKNKGTELGIRYAVNAILKAENNPDAIGEPLVFIVNEEGDNGRDPYTVYIYTTIKLYNQAALREVLRYVLPAGYAYKLLIYRNVFDGYNNPDILSQSDRVNSLLVNPTYAAQIRTSYDNPADLVKDENAYQKQLADKFIGAFDTTEIATSLSPAIEVGDNAENIRVPENLNNIDSGSDLDLENIINEIEGN